MNNIITAIIVDDELLAQKSLLNALEGESDIQVLAQCGNGFEALQAVQKYQPHLLFLDIQMPRLDGFDVVELLGKDAPLIIFVTSYDEYALRAFEAEALDYILKPVQPQRLQKALQRVRQQLEIKEPENGEVAEEQGVEMLVQKHRDSMSPLHRLLIRNGYDVVIIPVVDIVYIEAQDDYVKVFTGEGKSYLKSERMNRLEGILDSRTFCRIHRSYILNIDYLKKIEPYSKDSRIAILKGGQRLNISRSGYTKLMELL
jgi:two-component system, LytTR family, response regulator